MIVEVIMDPEGARVARTLFETPSRDVALGADAPPVGTVARLDPATGAVGEVIGEAGTARAALWRVAARYGLDPDHPPEVEAEADALVAAPGLDAPELEDLTELAFVTIDNEDSRDLDQALYIASVEGGGHDVYYALADASWYVRPNTALFDGSLARAASYYFPGFAIPMLPRSLSEGIVSLNEGELRRAFVMVMRVGADGRRGGTRFVRARIRSSAKLSYDGVQAYYDAPEASPLAGRVFTPTLDHLREVGERRIARAEARDVVQYNRLSVSVGLAGPKGRRFIAIGEARNACEKYNEQISLLCNVEGARLLAEAAGDATPVFRVHPAPAPSRLAALDAMIRALIKVHGLDRALWRWRTRRSQRSGGESLADYLDRLPKDGDGRPYFLAIQRQALLSNQRSFFQAEPGLHFGVGAEQYSRFSSPMREVVGIYTHLEAIEQLAGGVAITPEREALREAVIAAANRAKEVQRQITKEANLLVLDEVFGADLARAEGTRPLRRGTLLGLKFDHLYLQLEDPPFEVKVYLRDVARAVGGEAHDLGRVEAAITRPDGGRVVFRVGDVVAFRVAGHDAKRGRWLLMPEAVATATAQAK